ncbi:TetR family transcriptional regulator [Actinoplanes sp. NPDC023801]|uniref:TetR/AcrR family transcriptional regulator n=1 Tax=Actinoplanes sp. NPDC023801 TaxID=3154595 RepID=UPI0033EC6A97
MARDSAATRKALLDAAVHEFAEFGLAGARVDRVARRAGVNKERIYSNFGDKEGLFAEVLSVELARLAAAVPLSVPEGTYSLGNYAADVFDYHRTHPHLLRLLHWEALEASEGTAANDEDRRRGYSEKVAALREAQRTGRLPESPDGALLLYAVVALAAWWHAVPQVARMMLGPLADDPRAQRDELVRLVDRLTKPADR